MTTSDFKRRLQQVFLRQGFARAGKVLRRAGPGVVTLIAFEQGFGQQWFINVGFWLTDLGREVPNRIEHTHLYFRLERLLPEHARIIAEAGDLSENDQEQASAFEQLLEQIEGPFDSSLRLLGSKEGLESALRASRLEHGLIRKEARAFLAGNRWNDERLVSGDPGPS